MRMHVDDSEARSETLVGRGATLTSLDSLRSAREMGLHHVTDAAPGIARKGKPNAFHYELGQPARRVRDAETLERIRKLAIPPAWTQVWICRDATGHLQATGRDVRGRKQYRYHARYRQARDRTKYHHMLAFGHALPAIRTRTTHDLSLPGLPRDKVLAAVVRLLETGLIRVGNRKYEKQNNSFGLTTLRNRHVSIRRGTLHFEFRGKSGIAHAFELHEPRLAQIVKRCRELPGHELFQYLDDGGERHVVGSSDVNAYLRAASGHDFTAKDFRTWAGTVLAAGALAALPPFRSARQAKRNLLDAIGTVASVLGNTKSVCRKCYVHPAVLDAYLEGALLSLGTHRPRPAAISGTHLHADERALLSFLERHEKQQKQQKHARKKSLARAA